MNQSSRDLSWDLAKGICILLMIIGHCPGWHPIVYKAIESFHMPFFFIAAGWFFREKTTKEVVQSSFKRLLVPLLIGTCLCALICIIFGNTGAALSWMKGLLFPGGTGNKTLFVRHWPCLGVFWYLAALFWCRIIYNLIFKAIGNKHTLLICALISWFTITISRRIILPLGICEGLSGLVFYAAGHFAYNNNITSIKIPWYAIVGILLLWFVEIHFVSFRMFLFGYTWYLFPLGALFACAMGLLLYKLMNLLVKFELGNKLAWFGLFSLEVMCCHQICRTILGQLNKLYDISDIQKALFLFIASIILSVAYVSTKHLLFLRKG